jgi:hypothetical protein
VLIELPGGEGVVRRDDGEIVVTHDVSDDRGQPQREGDRYLPVKTWLHGDRSLVGGLLPVGAVSLEVVDDQGTRVLATIGGGAYAAILEQPNDGPSRSSAAVTPLGPRSAAHSLAAIHARG